MVRSAPVTVDTNPFDAVGLEQALRCFQVLISTRSGRAERQIHFADGLGDVLQVVLAELGIHDYASGAA